MTKQRYVSVSAHTAEHTGLYISRNTPEHAHSYSAYDSGEGVRISWGCDMPRHRYTSAHQIVRARRMALAMAFHVELTREH